MRIFRTLLMLTGVAAFMPSPPEDVREAAAQPGAELSTPSLLGSATMAVADVASFCTRQPGVCQTAGQVAAHLEAKAKYNVRLLYEWASDEAGTSAPAAAETETASDPMNTGSSTVIHKRVATSQSTLKLEDLIPPWRGPVTAKKS